MAIYNHIGKHRLQDWYHVEIIERDGSKYVRFHSRIHKNMPTELTYCYSTDFADHEILRDHSLLTKFIEHFGVASFTD